MQERQNIKKIVITGPESTGKTILAERLSSYYNTVFVPEYAREYVEKLQRPYSFNDIDIIARKQVELKDSLLEDANKVIFFDTYLIIIKVWFNWVFKKCPSWIIEEIERSQIDLFLLCDTDLPWEEDPVRENGGENRQILFEIYKKEITNYGFPYEVINGVGDERLKNAIVRVNEMI